MNDFLTIFLPSESSTTDGYLRDYIFRVFPLLYSTLKDSIDVTKSRSNVLITLVRDNKPPISPRWYKFVHSGHKTHSREFYTMQNHKCTMSSFNTMIEFDYCSQDWTINLIKVSTTTTSTSFYLDVLFN